MVQRHSQLRFEHEMNRRAYIPALPGSQRSCRTPALWPGPQADVLVLFWPQRQASREPSYLEDPLFAKVFEYFALS